jgi:RND superfamily putative drug exporter
MLDALGGFAQRNRGKILVLACLWFVVAAALLSSGLGRLATENIEGLESERAGKLIDAVTGRRPDTTFLAIFTSQTLSPTSAAFRDAVRKALEPLQHDSHVAAVTSPYEAPPLLAERMMNVRGHAVYAMIAVNGEFGDAAHAYPQLREKLRSDTLTITCTGRLPFTQDLERLLEHDLIRAEAISLPICVLLLAATFGTAMAALMPVCVGALAVVSGLAAVVLLSRFMELAQYTLNVCSLIGLGVAIDYSLFIVSRYREELDAGHDYPEALRRAVGTAGRVVLFSGFAVTVGLSGLLFFPRSYLMAMGLGGAIVVGFAVLFALTLLPALLSLLGPRIHWGRMPIALARSDSAIWHRMALWVMRRPVLVFGTCLCGLLIVGAPFLKLRMAAADVRIMPANTEARMGYDILRERFPDTAANHIIVAVEFPSEPALNPERIEALYDLVERVSALPNVTRAQSVVDPGLKQVAREAWPRMLLSPPPDLAPLVEQGKKLAVGGRTVMMDVTTDQPTDSDAARALVRAIRSDRRVADGSLVVAGPTAADVDATQYILGRAPHVVWFVVLVTYVVLFVLFRSVVLPIKAVIMNFLSITGSFGALVWVFQEGHLFVRNGHPVEPTVPLLLFCTLFGLSMDYEVLMLTRMKEAYDRGEDNRTAVAVGLEKSGSLITSAAVIMVAVFASFALARVVLMQAFGFGMALAVALDATIVRVLVVPATMRLLGDWNWWAPSFMGGGGYAAHERNTPARGDGRASGRSGP